MRTKWKPHERAAIKHLRHWRTARALADLIGVSKVAAYRVIRRISDAREMESKHVRQGKAGPLSQAFRLA